MQYGAYRRWKLAEDSNLDSKGKPKKNKKKSSTGYVAGDYKVDGANGGKAIGSRDVGSKKKNKGGTLNADSFYDAIKKFGSGVKVRSIFAFVYMAGHNNLNISTQSNYSTPATYCSINLPEHSSHRLLTLHYPTLHCTALHCTALPCSTLHCLASPSEPPYITTCSPLHCTALPCCPF